MPFTNVAWRNRIVGFVCKGRVGCGWAEETPFWREYKESKRKRMYWTKKTNYGG